MLILKKNIFERFINFNFKINVSSILNLDSDSDYNGNEEGEFDEEIIAGNGHESSAQWYTAENLSDEVELSAEGRATLERLLGNLNDSPGIFSNLIFCLKIFIVIKLIIIIKKHYKIFR